MIKEKSKSASNLDVLFDKNLVRLNFSPTDKKSKRSINSNNSTPSSSSKDREKYYSNNNFNNNNNNNSNNKYKNKNKTDMNNINNFDEDLIKLKSIKKVRKTWKDIPDGSTSSFSVGNWLDYLGLRQYENVFLNNGYETIEMVRLSN